MQHFATSTVPSTLVEKKGSIKSEISGNGNGNGGEEEKKKTNNNKWTSELVQNITQENLKNITQGVWLIDL